MSAGNPPVEGSPVRLGFTPALAWARAREIEGAHSRQAAAPAKSVASAVSGRIFAFLPHAYLASGLMKMSLGSIEVMDV